MYLGPYINRNVNFFIRKQKIGIGELTLYFFLIFFRFFLWHGGGGGEVISICCFIYSFTHFVLLLLVCLIRWLIGRFHWSITKNSVIFVCLFVCFLFFLFVCLFVCLFACLLVSLLLCGAIFALGRRKFGGGVPFTIGTEGH